MKAYTTKCEFGIESRFVYRILCEHANGNGNFVFIPVFTVKQGKRVTFKEASKRIIVAKISSMVEHS